MRPWLKWLRISVAVSWFSPRSVYIFGGMNHGGGAQQIVPQAAAAQQALASLFMLASAAGAGTPQRAQGPLIEEVTEEPAAVASAPQLATVASADGNSPGQELIRAMRGFAGASPSGLPPSAVSASPQAGGVLPIVAAQSPLQALNLAPLFSLFAGQVPNAATEAAAAPKKSSKPGPKLKKQSLITQAVTGPVNYRFVDFSKGHLDGCESEICVWTLSTEMMCNKAYESKIARIIKETRRRKGICNDPSNAGDPHASQTADDCDRYECMFLGIQEINGVWMNFSKDKNPEACLSAIQSIHSTLNNQAILTGIWQQGQRVPLYQREKLLRLKVAFTTKEVPLQHTNLLSLAGPESCEDACPEAVYSKMPDSHSSYTPANQQKPEYLKHYWTPGKFQFRLYDHVLKQLFVYAVKSEETFLMHYQRLFVSHFSHLANAPGSARAAAAEPQAKKAKVGDAPEEVSAEEAFGDMDVDFDCFENALLTREELDKKQNVLQLISPDSRDNAKWFCCLVWPDRFDRDSLEEALRQYESASPPQWIRTMQGCSYFTDIARASKVLLTKLKEFDGFYKGAVEAWEKFCRFLEATEALVGAVESELNTSAVRSINAWSREVCHKLVAMEKIDSLFEDLDAKFKDPRVQADKSSTLGIWRFKFQNSFATVVKICKAMLISCLAGVSRMPTGLAQRIDILSTSQAIVTEIMCLMMNMKAGQTHPLRVLQGMSIQEVETLSLRLRSISEMFNVIFDLAVEHYQSWEARILQQSDAVPSPEIQDDFNKITAKTAQLTMDKSTGKYAWALADAAPPHGRLQFFYRKLFRAEEVEVLKLLDVQQEAACLFVCCLMLDSGCRDVSRNLSQARDKYMAPFKLSGMTAFMASYGPLASCKSAGDELVQLWPNTHDCYNNAMTSLTAQYNSETNIPCADSEKIAAALDPIAGMQLPKGEAAAWVLTQKPAMATAFGQLMAIRRLQIVSAKPIKAWASKHTEKQEFLPKGFGRQLQDLDDEITKAEVYRTEANASTEKLETLCRLPEGEDKSLGTLLLPGVRRFMLVLDAAVPIRVAIANAAAKKGGNLICEQVKIVEALVDKDWQDWLGASALYRRSFQKIKTLMLVEAHKTIPGELDKLRDRIGLVKAADDVLKVDRYTSPAIELEHSGRLYVATSGAVLNTVVKKAKKVESNQLMRDIRICIKGMYQMRLWTRAMFDKEIGKNLPDDGKAVVSKVCSSLLVIFAFSAVTSTSCQGASGTLPRQLRMRWKRGGPSQWSPLLVLRLSLHLGQSFRRGILRVCTSASPGHQA